MNNQTDENSLRAWGDIWCNATNKRKVRKIFDKSNRRLLNSCRRSRIIYWRAQKHTHMDTHTHTPFLRKTSFFYARMESLFNIEYDFRYHYHFLWNVEVKSLYYCVYSVVYVFTANKQTNVCLLTVYTVAVTIENVIFYSTTSLVLIHLCSIDSFFVLRALNIKFVYEYKV